jgi:hypothetical protein
MPSILSHISTACKHFIFTVHVNNIPQYCKTLGIPIVKGKKIWTYDKVKVKA